MVNWSLRVGGSTRPLAAEISKRLEIPYLALLSYGKGIP